MRYARRNPGNLGHRGYIMAPITSITPQEGAVIVTLSCGHEQVWKPYPTYSAAAWAAHIQSGEKPLVVGKTRLRCAKQHEKTTEG